MHIIPENDFREHISDSSCWCKPKINEDGDYLHSSADGRELIEDLILERQETHTHIARVVMLWLEGVGEADGNEECALEWLGKRVTHFESLHDDYPRRSALASYINILLIAMNAFED